MLHFLFIKSSHSEIPSTCARTVVYEKTIGTWVHLEAGKKICAKSKGIIYINGKNISLEGYTGLTKKISGEGVIANLGSSDNEDYTYIIESPITQDIYIVSALNLPTYWYQWITTNNTHKQVDITNGDSYNDGYRGGYILLGPKINATLTINTTKYVEVSILDFEGNKKTYKGKTKYVLKGNFSGIWLQTVAPTPDDYCNVDLSSVGPEWATPFDGIYESSEYSIPNITTDFKQKKVSTKIPEKKPIINQIKIQENINYLYSIVGILCAMLIALVVSIVVFVFKTKNINGK